VASASQQQPVAATVSQLASQGANKQTASRRDTQTASAKLCIIQTWLQNLFFLQRD